MTYNVFSGTLNLTQPTIWHYLLKADTNLTSFWKVEGYVNLGAAVRTCSRCPRLYIGFFVTDTQNDHGGI